MFKACIVSRSGIEKKKLKHYAELELTVPHAQQRGAPKDRDKIDWKLITNLPVQSRADAIEKLEWWNGVEDKA